MAARAVVRRALRRRRRAARPRPQGVRADLKRRRPEHERDLRRRIADHIHARAARGDARLIADLADLVENPALRWGMGAEGSVRHRVDALREDDLPELERALRAARSR